MYWTNRGNGSESIAKARMDGSDPTTIVKSKVGYPGGITIDFDSLRLYWVDQNMKTIESAELDGSNRKTVADLKAHQAPFGIDILGNTLYWSEFYTKKIYKLGKEGGSESEFVAGTGDYVRHLAIYHEAKQKKGFKNRCDDKSGLFFSICMLAPAGCTCISP